VSAHNPQGTAHSLRDRHFGYLPVIVELGSAHKTYSLFLVPDSAGPRGLPPNIIEVTETREQAQEILDFYLSRRYAGARAGMVAALTLGEVLSSLLILQVALPEPKALSLHKILNRGRVIHLVRFYQKRPWKSTPLGEVTFQLVGIPPEDERSRMQTLIRSLTHEQS